jgi:hypothetical protein
MAFSGEVDFRFAAENRINVSRKSVQGNRPIVRHNEKPSSR